MVIRPPRRDVFFVADKSKLSDPGVLDAFQNAGSFLILFLVRNSVRRRFEVNFAVPSDLEPASRRPAAIGELVRVRLTE
jgi:hypothetical protein